MECMECEVLGNELASRWKSYQNAVVEYLRDPADRAAAKEASQALEIVAQGRVAKDEHRIAAHGWKPL